MQGTTGVDRLDGTGADDVLSGLDGDDRLFGGAGNDTLFGHSGQDFGAGAHLIDAVRVAGGFDRLIGAAFAHGVDGFVYVLGENRSGVVSRVDLETGAATTFLDVPNDELGDGNEEGLLGIAFHPDYAANGRFFLHTANQAGDIEIREFLRDAADPTVADPGSGQTVLLEPHPDFRNHNGGTVLFGPDGFLYISIGDGGGGFDPGEDAQDASNLLGAILRIDIDGDDFPDDPTRNYAIPADNPFAAGGGAPEIWHFGLRNPFRFSFDAATGDMYIGDVGQGRREEIDFQPAGQGGLNFGWDVLEGSLPGQRDPDEPAPDDPGLTGPAFEIAHPVAQSITGGVVNHGPGGAAGAYVFADFITGAVFAGRGLDGESALNVVDVTDRVASAEASFAFPSQFATDAEGAIYVTTILGDLFRLDFGPTSGDGADLLNGGDGADTIDGGAGADILLGEDGDDDLAGGPGDDRLIGGAGADAMAGGAGDDRYTVTEAGDVVTELPGEGDLDRVDAFVDFPIPAGVELLVGRHAATSLTLQGHDGGETIVGADLAGAGDAIDGGAGDDSLFGLAGDDVLAGGDDSDTLRGGAGRDTLQGGAGDDVLLGEAGEDDLSGGLGDDRLIGGDGRDSMAGGTGDDRYTVTETGDVVAELAGEGAADRIDAFVDFVNSANVEILSGRFSATGLTLTGHGGGESILGSDAADRLIGRAGDDAILGGDGRDRIFGNSGDDVITGGGGDDRVTGQFGADRFIHNPGDGDDVVTDFDVDQDRLNLRGHGLADFSGFQALTVDTTDGARCNLADGSVLLAGVAKASIGAEDVLL